MTEILIAEDEARIASFVEKGLTAAGFGVTVVATGTEALEQLSGREYDLAVLDIGLPGLDGLEVMRLVRARGSRTPVIILTARSSVEDVLASLEGGANDYMAKPFRFDELLARIRLRLADATSASAAATAATVLESGGVRLDLRTRRAGVDGRTVDLSAREFALAEEFLRHPGQLLSREQLLSRVWGYDFDPGSNVVDVYVGYLRQKLGAARIETVRGMGYRLV